MQVIPIWLDVRDGKTETKKIVFPQPVDVIATAAVKGFGGVDVVEVGYSGIVQGGAYRELGGEGFGSRYHGLVETNVTEIVVEARCWDDGWVQGVCTIFAYSLGTKDRENVGAFRIDPA